MKNFFIVFSLFVFFISTSCNSEDSSGTEATLAGSYSTILTIGNKLYAVSINDIYTFDITDRKRPVLINKQNIGFDIESLIHHEGILLIGSKSAMYIYSLDKNGIPVSKSQSSYNTVDFCSSDPIVAREKVAYVTISTTQVNCQTRTVNELRVYNIEDIKKPKQIVNISMSNPKGLGLGKNNLYICDQKEGLIIFDISNPIKPVRKSQFNGFKAYDLIVKNNLLLVVAEKQLRQYDITDENVIKYLGVIDL